MEPDDFEIPDLDLVPLPFGSPDLVEGYYELEAAERNQGMGTLGRHSEELFIWYRSLTLHYRAFLRGFNFECPDHELTAYVLRMQLLALGLNSSKAALDLLLAGYYSPAFATIRHMIETLLLCRYVEAWPREAAAFYRPEPGKPTPPARPKVQTMVAKLKRRYPLEQQMYERFYKGWSEMGNGSHPSGVGIVQTHGEQDGKGNLGATYHPTLFRDGITHGLVAALGLVHETGRLQPQGEEWEAQVVALGNMMMRTLAAPPKAPPS